MHRSQFLNPTPRTIDGLAATERQKGRKGHIVTLHTQSIIRAEPTWMGLMCNSRAKQCRNVSNWKTSIQNSNEPQTLLTFTSYSQCLSVGVMQARFQNTTYLFLKTWLSFDGYYSRKITEETLGAAWLEATCLPADKNILAYLKVQ